MNSNGILVEFYAGKWDETPKYRKRYLPSEWEDIDPANEFKNYEKVKIFDFVFGHIEYLEHGEIYDGDMIVWDQHGNWHEDRMLDE